MCIIYEYMFKCLIYLLCVHMYLNMPTSHVLHVRLYDSCLLYLHILIYTPHLSINMYIQVLVSAAEAAEMILRVDDIIKCAPRQREERLVRVYRGSV